MDKHTWRYLNEQHLHYDKEFSFESMLDCIKEGGDYGYLSSAINEFSGDQKQYLQFRLWDKQYGRDK